MTNSFNNVNHNIIYTMHNITLNAGWGSLVYNSILMQRNRNASTENTALAEE